VKPVRHLLIAAFLLQAITAAAAAQIPEGVEGSYEPHPEAQKAISQLLSPYCPGFMLEVCTAEESRILRDSIHALALEGWTAGELRGWMLAKYGDEYLALPQRSGWGIWAWILPPGALLLGLGAVVSVVRRISHPAGSDPMEDDAPGGPSPEEEARLREALRELELSEDPSY
jgi:cytochrome c-type biogenesis protein CcmH/NrfF